MSSDPGNPDKVDQSPEALSLADGHSHRHVNLRRSAAGLIVAGGLAAASIIGPLAVNAASPHSEASAMSYTAADRAAADKVTDKVTDVAAISEDKATADLTADKASADKATDMATAEAGADKAAADKTADKATADDAVTTN